MSTRGANNRKRTKEKDEIENEDISTKRARLSTRSSRTKATSRIKQIVKENSSSSDSDDDFILPSKDNNSSSSDSDDDFISPSTSNSKNKRKSTRRSNETGDKRKKADGINIESMNSFLSESDSSSDDNEEENPNRNSSNKKINSDSSSDDFMEVKNEKSNKDKNLSFEAIEENILNGVTTRLSDSDEDESENKEQNYIPTDVLFPQLIKDKNSPIKLSNLNEKKETDDNKIDTLDISQLLALGETQKPEKETNKKNISEKNKSVKKKIITNNEKSKKKKTKGSDSEDSDSWEEVEHKETSLVPKDGVEITLQLPEFNKRRKKKELDAEALLKRKMNQMIRENQVSVHKAGLLGWISHGRHINEVLNSPNLMALALSILPSEKCYPPKKANLKYLESITTWFKKSIPIKNEIVSEDDNVTEILEESFTTKTAHNKTYLVYMFIITLRAVGLKTRCIINLKPPPLKPAADDLCSISSKSTSNKKDAKPSTSKSSKNASTKTEQAKNSQSTPSKSKSESNTKETQKTKGKEKNSTRPEKETIKSNKNSPDKAVSRQTRSKKTTSEYFNKKDDEKKDESRNKIKTLSKNNKPEDTNINRSLRKRRPSKYKDDTGSGSEDEKKGEKSYSSPVKPSPKSANKSVNLSKPTSKISKSPKNIHSGFNSESDSDFEPEIIKVKKGTEKVVDRRVLSSSSSEDIPKKHSNKKNGMDHWAEVFLEAEEKWISVDVPNGKIHCVKELYSHATSPVTYVLAFANDLSIRDVSKRYCPQYYTVTRKQRVDEIWWDEAIKPFYGQRTAHDKEEEEDLERQLQDRPLPTSISEFKSHPLYVLTRHLLKFEAIYPPKAPTLGFIRGEAIYSRDCVFTCRSRETWLKEAKIVKPKEEAYKIVKARPKYDRMTGQKVTDKPLEVFGPWQVEDYVPPPAKDGKVPRNEYGNVELFKPTMLPKGTVHLVIPCLNRIAKKLNIDCAPAMVGFDYHCGGCHPVFDGFVVCEEFKDLLIDAHRQEEEEKEKRNEEKRLKRVYGNWKRLINGLLIRENLKKKYSFGKDTDNDSMSKSSTSSKTRTNKPTSSKTSTNKPSTSGNKASTSSKFKCPRQIISDSDDSDDTWA